MTSGPFVPGVGAIFSADIAVPEHEREMRFYSRVLTTGENPLWREDLMNNKGMPIIGLGARTAEYEHLPVQWMPHIQVADVATSVQRAVELGGSELMHVKGRDGKSQWAVLQDLNGATFGVVPIIPAEALPSVERTERVGRVFWFSLSVPDTTATVHFYQQVIGWKVKITGTPGGTHHANYTVLGVDGTEIGAIHHMFDVPAEIAHLVPPQPPKAWMLFLPVGDVGESLRRVTEEGGTFTGPMSQVDEEGRNEKAVAAIVKDPVGAYFTLILG